MAAVAATDPGRKWLWGLVQDRMGHLGEGLPPARATSSTSLDLSRRPFARGCDRGPVLRPAVGQQCQPVSRYKSPVQCAECSCTRVWWLWCLVRSRSRLRSPHIRGYSVGHSSVSDPSRARALGPRGVACPRVTIATHCDPRDSTACDATCVTPILHSFTISVCVTPTRYSYSLHVLLQRCARPRRGAATALSA